MIESVKEKELDDIVEIQTKRGESEIMSVSNYERLNNAVKICDEKLKNVDVESCMKNNNSQWNERKN